MELLAQEPPHQPAAGKGEWLRVGEIALGVRDLRRVAGFYRDVIGLDVIAAETGAVRLGAGGRIVLDLLHRPGTLPDDPAAAGLVHTAFLLPSRADLGRWLCHAAALGHPLDAAAMHRAGQALKGRHDFHSFETNWPNRTSSVRTITHLAVNRMGSFVWIDAEADGFLYNMVRTIAGTLIYVGLGRWPESRVAEVIAAEDRAAAGPTAPPQGLFLIRVRYAGDP